MDGGDAMRGGVLRGLVLIALGVFGAMEGGRMMALETPRHISPYLEMPERMPTPTGWRVVPAYGNLRIKNWVGFLPEPGSDRLIAFSRDGIVYSFENDPDVQAAEVILDLSGQTQSWGDAGLVNMVFHPGYTDPESPGYRSLFVWYNYVDEPDPQAPAEFTTFVRLSRFQIDDETGLGDPSSERVLIEQTHRHQYHAGGGMFFHPVDGFLYIALSDEGGGNDGYHSAQNINESFFSGVIRIDVDRRGGDISFPIRNQPARGRSAEYYIPSDNPWVSRADALHEFYAVGLRNPHRMTYDPVRKVAWIADVGQDKAEELNLLVKGANYGWPFREGNLAGPRSRPAPLIGEETAPYIAYGRDRGFCVIGGDVYQGQKWAPYLSDRYVFADLGGWVMAVDQRDPVEPALERLAYIDGGWATGGLGRDHDGELYFVHFQRGRVYTIEPIIDEPERVPARLSETGVFSDTANLVPINALVAYSVNSPLWSDGADKHRWMGLPGEAEFDPENPWVFPEGTVFVKHFEMQTHWANAEAVKRLETRLLVLDSDGGAYGMTYRWNEEGTEAFLLETRETETFVVETESGLEERTWVYPSPQDCIVCHTDASGHVLGAHTSQLNLIAGGGQSGVNQLELLHDFGLLDTPITSVDAEALPRLADPSDITASLNDRVRSYLDSNCSGCHRPGGVRAGLDLRSHATLAETGLFGVANSNLGIPGLRLVEAGEPEASAVFHRVRTRGENQMPPLASEIPDPLGVPLVKEWIESVSVLKPVVQASWMESGAAALSFGNNLVPSMDSIEIDRDWWGYFGKPPVVARDQTDPMGGTRALRFGSADIGGPWEAVSGFVVAAHEGLEEATYHVSVWLRTVEGTMEMRFGLTDWGNDTVVTVTPEWTLYEWTVDYVPCDCFLDDRLFQVYEGLGENPEWEMAFPQTRKVTAATSGGAVVLRQDNLLPSMDSMDVDKDWWGYFGKPPVLERNVPDPMGEPTAVRFGSADRGGPWGAVSGFIASTLEPLEEATYHVSVWLRTVEGSMPMRFGLTDWGNDTVVTVTTDWTLFEWTVDYSPCNCFIDNRVFQVYESKPENQAWEMAYPRVHRMVEAGVSAVAVTSEGQVQKLTLKTGAGRSVTIEGNEGQLTGYFDKPGTYSVQVEAENDLGIRGLSEPLLVQVGPPPRLVWEQVSGGEPRLMLEISPNQPFELWDTTDLVEWNFGEERVSKTPWMPLPDSPVDGEGTRFFHAVPIAKPLP